MCDGRCRELAADEVNCGACGNVCTLAQSCVSGSCAADCTRQLHAPISDSRGFAWDGLERPVATHSAARTACEAIGGRLPSLSELHRVSAVKTGAVADASKTNAIWAITPSNGASNMAIALSDGVTSVRTSATATPYRCVCPPPTPESFSGGACQGAPGAECFSFTNDQTLNYDSEDRPAATKAAAVWECAFSGGQLATPERLAAAIIAGLPNGADAWLHTGDQTSAAYGTLLKWVNASWTANGNVFVGNTDDLHPFRCAGPRSADIVSASSVTDGVVAPATRVVADGADRSAATFAAAVDTCFDASGHLGTGSELASVAMQGLPRLGVTGFQWTGDETENGGAGSYDWTGIARWPGGTGATADGLGFVSPTSIGTSAKTALLPYRCLHHPVDTSYVGPTECNGGCTYFETAAGRESGAPVKIWFDAADRAATTYSDAVYRCSSVGGRLASARDLVEGIKNGLPGIASGTPVNVLTADLAGRWVLVTPRWCALWWMGICLIWVPDYYDWRPGIYAIPQWTGSGNGNYADDAGVRLAPTDTAMFRCVWTNEIR